MVPVFCIMDGLIWRYWWTLPEHLPIKNWWLGICVDVSKTLGISVYAVRFYVMLYTPLGFGLTFYLIYYWFIINRVPIPFLTTEHEIQITKIKSYYFGS
jgi:phage shock protein PspC (stress-responsive transcriptional regulator)